MKLRYLIIAIIVLIIDQWTKYWALTSLKLSESIEVIPGYFRFTYATNRGVAFSMFADSQFNVRVVFATVSTIAALFVGVYLLRTAQHKVRLNISLSLLLAGIIGNLIDRVRLGEVVDFLDFHLADKYAWPTFNVADAAICIGAALLALEMLREERSTNLKSTVSNTTSEEGGISPSD